MELTCFVVSEPQERAFTSTGHDGSQRNSTVIDAHISDGLNEYLVSGFDMKRDNFPAVNGWGRFDLQFSVRSTEKDGAKRLFQSIRCIRVRKM
jgi:hypothetical protein